MTLLYSGVDVTAPPFLDRAHATVPAGGGSVSIIRPTAFRRFRIRCAAEVLVILERHWGMFRRAAKIRWTCSATRSMCRSRMFGSSAASRLSPWRRSPSARPSMAACVMRAFSDQLGQVTRLPIASVIRHFQIGQELALEGGEHLDERHMAFDRSELCLDEAPGRFLESTLFRVFDIGQTDEPSLGRHQQTGRFVPRCKTEDDAADHTLGIVVGPGPPDLHLAAGLQRKVEQAVLEILDPRDPQAGRGKQS